MSENAQSVLILSAILYGVGTFAWVLGWSISFDAPWDREGRRFAARMLIATPAWPFLGIWFVGRKAVGFVRDVISEADLRELRSPR